MRIIVFALIFLSFFLVTAQEKEAVKTFDRTST